MDTSSDTIDLIRAIAAPLAIVAPLLVFWFQKRDRLQRTKDFIEMLKAREELKAVQSKQTADPVSPVVAGRIRDMLMDLERELNRSSEKQGISPFIVTVLVGTFLVSLVFTQLSDYLNKVFLGKSYESGMLFLEGIFQSATSRFLLLMAYVSISLFLTMKTAKPVSDRMTSALKKNVALLLIFNLIFIAVTILISLLLILLDPVVDLW